MSVYLPGRLNGIIHLHMGKREREEQGERNRAVGEGYMELIVNCKRCAATGTDYVCGNEDCRIPPIPHTAQRHTHSHTLQLICAWPVTTLQ